jgi:midasin (ATPase involved in ribosome maturation)
MGDSAADAGSRPDKLQVFAPNVLSGLRICILMDMFRKKRTEMMTMLELMEKTTMLQRAKWIRAARIRARGAQASRLVTILPYKTHFFQSNLTSASLQSGQVQRNKNSVAPDRKLQSQLRKNIKDGAKQPVEKLIKAELLQGGQDEDDVGEGGGDDENVDLADKIQAEVVGADSKADGHALAGGNMDESDNIMPPPDAENSDGDAADSGELEEEEEESMQDGGKKSHDQEADTAVDEAVAKPKEKKRKTSTKPGEGNDSRDSSATPHENDAADSSGVIIVTNALIDCDDDHFADGGAHASSLAVSLPIDRSSMNETQLLKKWQDFSSESSVASRELCEALRLILEPTLASRMHGDFKTGKRINMRKVRFKPTLQTLFFIAFSVPPHDFI